MPLIWYKQPIYINTTEKQAKFTRKPSPTFCIVVFLFFVNLIGAVVLLLETTHLQTIVIPLQTMVILVLCLGYYLITLVVGWKFAVER